MTDSQRIEEIVLACNREWLMHAMTDCGEYELAHECLQQANRHWARAMYKRKEIGQ